MIKADDHILYYSGTVEGSGVEALQSKSSAINQ